MIRLIVAFAAVLAFSTTLVLARPISDQERAAIEKAVVEFQGATVDRRYADLIDRSLSSKMLKKLSVNFKVPEDRIKPAVAQVFEQSLKTVIFETFSMDIQHAEYRELPNGQPYALLPTTTVVKIQDTRVKGKEYTVALFDEGRWFLVRVAEKQQIDLLRDAYPDFTSVSFPASSMEILNQ